MNNFQRMILYAIASMTSIGAWAISLIHENQYGIMVGLVASAYTLAQMSRYANKSMREELDRAGDSPPP